MASQTAASGVVAAQVGAPQAPPPFNPDAAPPRSSFGFSGEGRGDAAEGRAPCSSFDDSSVGRKGGPAAWEPEGGGGEGFKDAPARWGYSDESAFARRPPQTSEYGVSEPQEFPGWSAQKKETVRSAFLSGEGRRSKGGYMAHTDR